MNPVSAGGDDQNSVVLSVSGLGKSFGPTHALVGADFVLRRGNVLALMGENGSGKSTLVKILTGVHRPDSGTLELDGKSYAPQSPADAISCGVVAVYQEILTVPGRSVLENVWMGSGGFLRRGLAEADKRRIADEYLRKLVNTGVDLDAPAGALSVSTQQAVCITRALVREPRLLILDESTSALDVETRNNLFSIVHDRSAQGDPTVFISHRMDEVLEIADTAAVLRSGKSVGSLVRADITPDRLVQLMTGAEQLVPRQVVEAHKKVFPATRENPVLSVRGLVLQTGSAPVDFDLLQGELVGLAGLEGHGQDLFLDRLAAGSRSREITVSVAGGAKSINSRRSAFESGMVYVPRNRRSDGIFPTLSTRLNFAAPTLRQDRRRGLINNAATRSRFAVFVDRLRIKVNDDENLITTLSGGNQQKVIISRWLAIEPRILLLSDPTRGIDLGAKHDIYAELERLTERGISIVMLSSEVDELVDLMDRVLVFREGSVFAELPRKDITHNSLVSNFFGHETEVPHA